MSDLNDIVAVGLDLKPKTLLHAYQNGVFPWPSPGLPLLWHCPKRRGILRFEDLNVNRRLKQYLAKASWEFTTDTAFRDVIEACSERGDEGTWITEEMKDAYTELHRLGHAHSVEVWNGDRLVGGLYGVDTAGTFAGESMFHREANASKAALLYTIALLKRVGREWMDIQVVTPHMTQLGAREIAREQFLRMLARAKKAQTLGTGVQPFAHRERVRYQFFSSAIE